MDKNGSTWIRWALGIIVLALSTTVSYVIANDSFSRSRDSVESDKRELLKCDIIRLDTNQKAVMIRLDKVVENQDKLLTLIPIVARLERKIDSIQ